jgi:hypothetical protein
MARPESNTVSYFPHKIGDGKKIFSIEAKYGNDGYATWFKILEKLATTENHYLDLNDEVEVMYLSAKCKVSEEVLFSIINDLLRLGCFDKILWEKRYLWSQVFIDSIQDAYSRRNNKCITYEGLCKHLSSLCSTETELLFQNHDNNTQSKVKKRKVKEKVVPNVKTLDIDFDRFIDNFNSFSNRNFKVTDKVKSSLIARLKDYSKIEILQAIENAHKDEYHIETDFKYLTPEFILRQEKIEKFLNAPIKKNIKSFSMTSAN